MKKYHDYRNSNINWIGAIPVSWNILPLKKISAVTLGKMLASANKGTDVLKPYLRSQNIQINQVNLNDVKKMWFSPDELKKYRLKDGDILVNEGGDIGRTCLWRNELPECYIQNSVNRVKILDGVSRYYLYHFYLYHQTGYFESIVNKVSIPHLTKEKLENVMFVVPSIDEQAKISNYLDYKTSQIDKLISDKEKLIQLLNEERTALINHIITKGINPDVPMKDTGIEWLGTIPSHWNLKRVKHLNKKIGSGVTPKGGAEVYQDEGVPFLRSQNIYFEGFKLDNVPHISEQIHASMTNSKVYSNDVLLNITGGSIGRCFYVTNEFNEANVNQHVCIIRPNEKILTVYLYNLLRSFVGQLQIDNCQIGGNRESVNFEQLKNFIFPVPDIEEQEKILSYFYTQDTRINSLINDSEKEIQLLKEYKTALISEVVTGKIDIRNEVISALLETA